MNWIRVLWHNELEPITVLEHVPVQLPQPDWKELRARAVERHGKPLRCDTLIKKEKHNAN